jgi:hypothetical protein
MSWLRLPLPDASPELARSVRSWTARGEPVPTVIAPMMLRPASLRGVMQMNNAVTFGGSGLGRRREELIATAVSAVQDCFF